MTEVFLVNYTPTPHLADNWACHHMTHSPAIASAKAQELRDMGYRVTIQSVLINDNGKVEL